MAKIEVRVFPEGGRNRLELYHEGAHIGDYERSIDKHVDAKVAEAEGASDRLLEAYRRHGGKIAVRFNKPANQKEIRTYQKNRKDPGMGGTVLDLILNKGWTKRKP